MALDPAVQAKPASGQMVMVACKHPNGVVLNLDRIVPIGNNGQVRVVHGASVRLAGWSHEYNKVDPAAETGGYVLTPIPAEFWVEWLKAHPDFPMLVDKTILGPHRDHVGQARDHAEVPKMFAPSSGDLKAIDAAKLTKD
jgi:hypothetical protein